MSAPSDVQAKKLNEFNQQIAALTNSIAAFPRDELTNSEAAWEKYVEWMLKGDRLLWKEVKPVEVISSALA